MSVSPKRSTLIVDTQLQQIGHLLMGLVGIPQVPSMCVLTATILALLHSDVSAAADYQTDVKPVLTARCYSCHGVLKQEGDLRLDTVDLMLKGGDSGPAIVAEDIGSSVLMERITSDDEDLRMPPEGHRLTSEQIDFIVEWIQQGAAAPEDEKPQTDPAQHWAFQAPGRPQVPEFPDDSFVRNPIDAFVRAQHKRHGLQAAVTADSHVLLRRLHLDLTGLPPTTEQLQSFLNDHSDASWNRIVDALLNDPGHGERWGRHWMDVWRYSDWYGRRKEKDVRNSYPHIWRWRDWIVSSLNDDKGYDQMIREMLAADEISPADNENIVALGFIVRNWFSLNYDQWKRDLVEHTGKAFLGIRMNCAHCHDHKYDPIANRDFFRFRAFFEPLELRHDRVADGPDLPRYIRYGEPGSSLNLTPIEAGIARVFDIETNPNTYMYRNGDARLRIEGEAPVAPGVPSILGGDTIDIAAIQLPVEAWYPGFRPEIQEAELRLKREAVSNAEGGLKEADQNSPQNRAAQQTLEAARASLTSVQLRIAADRLRYAGPVSDANTPSSPDVQAAIAAAIEAEQHAKRLNAEADVANAEVKLQEAQALNPTDADRDKKISAAQKTVEAARKLLDEIVAQHKTENAPTDYTPLTPQYPRTSSGRRAALADWIASRKNPLTARVAVNHIWMRHFGQPLVDSVFDFGLAGDEPTHMELLDWLAVEFMESGWSMKHMHRLMLTSSTYRMASADVGAAKQNAATDPDNRYLWKFNQQRMQAETIRDSILHVSGSLDRTMGGQELENSQSETSLRRSLYFTVYPEVNGSMAFATYFDPPSPVDCYQRSVSIMPQQALAMTNSELSIRQSRELTRRLTASLNPSPENSPNDSEFVTMAFRTVLSRQPADQEVAACEQFLRTQRDLPDNVMATNNKETTDTAQQSSKPSVIRARESLVRSLFSHHDFVTIH